MSAAVSDETFTSILIGILIIAFRGTAATFRDGMVEPSAHKYEAMNHGFS